LDIYLIRRDIKMCLNRTFLLFALSYAAFVVYSQCPIRTVSYANYLGAHIEVHNDFVQHIQQINDYAGQSNVKVYITSSFRKNASVGGAIVPPATKSNHMVGHAIDMNVMYNGNTLCNSVCLAGTMPPAVHTFIQKIRNDPALRWGGDFTERDTVHIDDGLNIHNAAKWDQEYVQAQRYC